MLIALSCVGILAAIFWVVGYAIDLLTTERTKKYFPWYH